MESLVFDDDKASSPATIEEGHDRKRDSTTSPDGSRSGKRRLISNPRNGNDGLVKTIGDQLLATEIVGEEFIEYINRIWSSLMDDDVSRIGIPGMGGAGKTEVAKHINNKLLQVPNRFHHVFWVNASPDWSIWNQANVSSRCRIHKLQSSISNAVGVDLSDIDDENRRAARLYKVLTEKKKCVLIVDDVWDYISLLEVGIPIGMDRCTVVITTRSLKVCRQFGCQKNVEVVGLLNANESYQLFMKNLGKETTLSKEVEKILKLVVDKCGGLPLAIKIMASNMRGVTDIHLWRNALEGHIRKKVDDEIFQELKLSYDYLKDPTLQQCFFYCALFLGKPYETLVEHLNDEGLIERMKRRRGELNEVEAIISFLRDVYLLRLDNIYFVMTNEVLWRFTHQLMEANQQRAMIRNDASLKALPEEESWTGDLARVSLTGNGFESIPSNFKPTCPKLSTLLLSQNHALGYIGDSFFEGLPRLKVLSLSETSIKSLPQSVFNLVNLTTLLLSRCINLRKIPSVAKLKALKKLDLSFSGVDEVPDGIELLSKLVYLDLFDTKVKELNSGIFGNLLHMQFLRLPWLLAVRGEELVCLSRLEDLTCRFYNLTELNKYLASVKGFKERIPEIKMHVQAGGLNTYFPYYTAFDTCLFSDGNDRGIDGSYDYGYEDWSVVGFRNCNINEEVNLQNNFQQIVIERCNEPRSFCNFFPIKNAAEFKHFSVRFCSRLEFLLSLSLLAQGTLEKLECIELIGLKNFRGLFGKEEGVAAFQPYRTCFSHLTRFLIRDCPSIKQLLPFDLLPSLKNLEQLCVLNCPLLEEIILGESSMVEQEKPVLFPKLCYLWLENLPELKSLFNVPSSCRVLISRCPKIKADTSPAQQ